MRKAIPAALLVAASLGTGTGSAATLPRIPGIITTFAGDGSPAAVNPACDVDPTTVFRCPTSLAVDGGGNVYVVDTYHHQVKKVSPAGVVSLVAGTGAGGYTGDGGLATGAELYYPSGVALDGSGNVYIADRGNNVVREVSGGTITTIAGNGSRGYSGDHLAATSAELDAPTGVAVDAAGSVYIADEANHVVRKVTSGVIGTFAGTYETSVCVSAGDGGPATSAELCSPIGIAFDTSGLPLIIDHTSIRKVDSSGMISTVAGDPSHSCGRSDPLGDYGPATSADLCHPHGLAVDALGDMFIADSDDSRIREVLAANGMIVTVAGKGKYNVTAGGYSGDGGTAICADLDGPWGVALDGSGDLYIADENNNRVRVVGSPRPPRPDNPPGAPALLPSVC